MKRKVLYKITIFVFLLFFLLEVISHILVQKWIYSPDQSEGESNRYAGFYDLPVNSIDYAVLGASHSFYSVNPMQIYSQTNSKGYILGSPGQPIEISYYWLQEMYKRQTPQYIFLDVSSMLYDSKDRKEANITKALINMAPSILKIKAISNCKTKEQSFIELFFPLFQFHSRWTNLGSFDFSKVASGDMPKGACINFRERIYTTQTEINEHYAVNYSEDIPDGSIDIPKISLINQRYFNNIYKLCQKHNSKLIPIKYPTLNWSNERSLVISEFMNSYDLDFVDIASGDTININWLTDTCDSGYHTNYYGMTKVSNYMSLKLLEYNQTPFQQDPLWDADLENYKQWEQKQLLTDEQIALNYLSVLSIHKEDYYIVVSIKDEACAALNGRILESLHSIGMKSLFKNIQNSYIAIIDSGNNVFEQWASSPIKLNTFFEDDLKVRHEIQVESGGFTFGNISSVSVDDQEYSLNLRGLNIVVLSKKNGNVVSSMSIDTHISPLKFVASDITNSVLMEGCQLLENDIYYIIPTDFSPLSLSSYRNVCKGILEYTEVNNALNNGGGYFKITYISDGLYILENLHQNKYLSVPDGKNSSGTITAYEDYTGLSEQKWFICNTADNTYSIFSAYNGLALSVCKFSNSTFGYFQLSEIADQSTQRFFIRKAVKE